jgi:hypothetical protein
MLGPTWEALRNVSYATCSGGGWQGGNPWGAQTPRKPHQVEHSSHISSVKLRHVAGIDKIALQETQLKLVKSFSFSCLLFSRLPLL